MYGKKETGWRRDIAGVERGRKQRGRKGKNC